MAAYLDIVVNVLREYRVSHVHHIIINRRNQFVLIFTNFIVKVCRVNLDILTLIFKPTWIRIVQAYIKSPIVIIIFPTFCTDVFEIIQTDVEGRLSVVSFDVVGG